MSSLAETYYTPEQYLALERAAKYKSESIDGKVYARAGTASGCSPRSAAWTVCSVCLRLAARWLSGRYTTRYACLPQRLKKQGNTITMRTRAKTEATMEDLMRVPGKAELVNGEIVHMPP